MSVKLPKITKLTADERLMKRRECEFDLFRSVEQVLEMPNICTGFTTVESFIADVRLLNPQR